MRLMLIAAALFLVGIQPAFSQAKDAAVFAEYGGRVTGAAKACGFDGDQVSQAGAKVLIVARSQAKGPERAAVESGFSYGQGQGEKSVASKRIKCDTARSDFSSLQAELATKLARQ